MDRGEYAAKTPLRREMLATIRNSGKEATFEQPVFKWFQSYSGSVKVM